MDYKGVIINNLKAAGTLTPAEQRAQFKNVQYSINTPYDVVVKGSNLNLNGYNCIEIGLNANVAPCRSVTIEDCNFDGTLTNNAILVFATQDNTVINIKRCHFKALSNLLRLSNRTNATGVVVNIEDCVVDDYEKNLQWRGLFLFENYTDKTVEEVEANNRFGGGKITINIKNLVCEGKKFTATKLAEVTNTAQDDQMFIWCQDYIQTDYIPAYDPDKLPDVTVDDVPMDKAALVIGDGNGMAEEE